MNAMRCEFMALLVVTLYATQIQSQIPAFGGCPRYEPMRGFNKELFMGRWYEAERLFAITELASRCVSVMYEQRPDGRTWVDNFITNRFTGVQRKISGIMKMTSKNDEAKYNVRYNSLPINYDTTLNILDTDYNTFAVIYSCSEIGPLGHAQSVWLMTRERVPPGPVLQRAYGVLDRNKISRNFFIKTEQTDCEIVAPPQETVDTDDSADGSNSDVIEVGRQWRRGISK